MDTCTEGPPTRQRLLQIERVIKAIRIGSRIRYHQEYDEASQLESLVVGYQIDDRQIFRQADLLIEHAEQDVRLRICAAEGSPQAVQRVEDFDLLVPDTDGDELKLDYDSRANLSRRGPFAPRSHLVIMSANFNGESEAVKFAAEVRRRQKIGSGVHAGLAVVTLGVQLGTLESHEPRKSARLSTNLCVTACKNGTEELLEARLIDFAGETMRLVLEEGQEWPPVGKKEHMMVSLKTAVHKPVLRLRCEEADTRGDERILKVTHLMRPDGKLQPYQKIDALEIKVDLMNL